MEQKKSKKRLIFWIAILILFLVLILLAIWFFARLNKPVTATIRTSQGQVNQNNYNIDLTPVKQIGSYASFNHPKGVLLISSALISNISVEDYNYYVKDVYSWTLAIDIIRTPTGELTESSSYNLRVDNPSVYSESRQNINGQPVIVYTDTSFTEGFSKVAYLIHGDYVGIVSLIGNDTNGTAPLATTFNMVLNSWTWEQ